MHKCAIDLRGMRFGRLEVIEDAGRRDGSGNVYWRCRCDCGVVKTICASSLWRARYTKSCGCLSRELSRDRALAGYKKKPEIYGPSREEWLEAIGRDARMRPESSYFY